MPNISKTQKQDVKGKGETVRIHCDGEQCETIEDKLAAYEELYNNIKTTMDSLRDKSGNRRFLKSGPKSPEEQLSYYRGKIHVLKKYIKRKNKKLKN